MLWCTTNPIYCGIQRERERERERERDRERERERERKREGGARESKPIHSDNEGSQCSFGLITVIHSSPTHVSALAFSGTQTERLKETNTTLSSKRDTRFTTPTTDLNHSGTIAPKSLAIYCATQY